MNKISFSTRNFLIVQDNHVFDEILNFTIEKAKSGQRTLILSRHSKINIQNSNFHDQTHLNRIIIMYFDDIEKMISKILELHEWSVIPNAVIIDLNSFFVLDPNLQQQKLQTPTKKKISLLISSLFNYMQFLENRTDHLAVSIVVADKEKVPKNYYEFIVDVYYYNSAFNNFQSLKNNLPIV